MIRLGEKQILEIAKFKEFGVYLKDLEGGEETILLPKKMVPEYSEMGDQVEVFVYRDSSDRLIATTKEPALTLGEVKRLEVKEVAKVGAFLDWGLEKDLLLPFKEQEVPVRAGMSCLVALYIDKSKRLCATMKIYEYLKTNPEYEKDEVVEGTVYQINESYGVFVAVDDLYHGMILQKDVHRQYKIGETLRARVKEVRPDGKVELTPNAKVEEQMDIDAKKVLELLESYAGVLPFSEKASPAVIERELGISKAAFKRAVGRLLKAKHIQIADGKIRLNKEQ